MDPSGSGQGGKSMLTVPAFCLKLTPADKKGSCGVIGEYSCTPPHLWPFMPFNLWVHVVFLSWCKPSKHYIQLSAYTWHMFSKSLHRMFLSLCNMRSFASKYPGIHPWPRRHHFFMHIRRQDGTALKNPNFWPALGQAATGMISLMGNQQNNQQ